MDSFVDTFVDVLVKCPHGTIITVKWKNGLEIKAGIDSLYYADNGLNEDEDGYKDFFACLLYVVEILKETTGYAVIEDEDFIYVSMQNPPKEMKSGYYNVKVGDFIEISIQNLPIEIRLEDDDSVIWKR